MEHDPPISMATTEELAEELLKRSNSALIHLVGDVKQPRREVLKIRGCRYSLIGQLNTLANVVSAQAYESMADALRRD